MREVDAASGSGLAGFDLNLLRFLLALVDTASITQAGVRVGLSQPAASRAVARLRLTFGDALLVRTSRGYVLTPLAESLAPTVRQALATVGQLLEGVAFEPARSTRRFALACTDYGMTVVLLPLLAVVKAAAPGVSLQVDHWSDDTLARMESGELDSALFADERLPPDFHYRRLFSERYALVVRRNHPLVRLRRHGARELLEAARKYDQFAPRYLAEGRFHTDDLYGRLAMAPPRRVLTAPFFYAGVDVALGGDTVGVVPERAARAWAERIDVTVLPLRGEPSLDFEMRLVWHERAHRDAGLAWLRKTIVSSTDPAALAAAG